MESKDEEKSIKIIKGNKNSALIDKLEELVKRDLPKLKEAVKKDIERYKKDWEKDGDANSKSNSKN